MFLCNGDTLHLIKSETHSFLLSFRKNTTPLRFLFSVSEVFDPLCIVVMQHVADDNFVLQVNLSPW